MVKINKGRAVLYFLLILMFPYFLMALSIKFGKFIYIPGLVIAYYLGFNFRKFIEDDPK